MRRHVSRLLELVGIPRLFGAPAAPYRHYLVGSSQHQQRKSLSRCGDDLHLFGLQLFSPLKSVMVKTVLTVSQDLIELSTYVDCRAFPDHGICRHGCLVYRRMYGRQSSNVETSGECRMTCMWHVGLHYLLPFSLVTAEEHCRHVLSQDVAGISAYFFLSTLGVVDCSQSILLSYCP